MRLLAYFLPRFRSSRRLALLAREVAESCQAEVWNRVRGEIFGMSMAEARGYVRARAMAPIRREAASVLSVNQAAASVELQQLMTLATDRVVQRILCDLLAGSPRARRAA